MADYDRRGGGGGGGYNSKKRRYRGEFSWNLFYSFTFRPYSRYGLLGPCYGQLASSGAGNRLAYPPSTLPSIHATLPLLPISSAPD